MSDDYAHEDGTYDTAYRDGYGGAYPGGDGTTGGGMDARPDEGFAPGDGIWQPLAQGGEFDAEATMNTAFTGQLPDFGAIPAGREPLAAPGHGYVPEHHGLPEPPAVPDPHVAAHASYEAPEPVAGQPWAPAEPAGEYPVPDGTGVQWSVPFAPEDPAEASGEYSVGQMVAPPHTAPEGLPDPLGPGTPREQPGPDLFDFDADPAPESEPADDPAPVADDDPAQAPEPGDPHSEHPTSSYVLTVNGAERPVTDAWLGESLLYVLRERLGLAGAKDGCEQGECGACSVQVDGRLVASCLMPAAVAAGCEVRTVEGLAVDGRLSDVQRALADRGAVQCGFCVPGFAMTVHDLLEGNHRPTELETRQALSGNLCRCSGYQGVLDAVAEVIAARAAAHDGDAGHEPVPDGEATGRIPHQSTGEPDGATS